MRKKSAESNLRMATAWLHDSFPALGFFFAELVLKYRLESFGKNLLAIRGVSILLIWFKKWAREKNLWMSVPCSKILIQLWGMEARELLGIFLNDYIADSNNYCN